MLHVAWRLRPVAQFPTLVETELNVAQVGKADVSAVAVHGPHLRGDCGHVLFDDCAVDQRSERVPAAPSLLRREDGEQSAGAGQTAASRSEI